MKEKMTLRQSLIKKEEYYNNQERLSQSRLKLLLKSPKLFLDNPQSELTPSLLLGTVVDEYITDPNEFHKNFIILPDTLKVSDAVKNIIQHVVDDKEGELEDKILRAYEKENYQSNWKPETKIKNFEKMKDYYDFVLTNADKTIVDQETYNTALMMAENLKERALKEYENTFEYTIEKQLPILFEYDGVPLKALLDYVVVDDVNKTIKVIDIKTTSDYVTEFPKSFKKFGYGYQAEMYRLAMLKAIEYTNYSEYTVLPFEFAVVSSKDGFEVATFVVSNKTSEDYQERLINLIDRANKVLNGYDILTEKYVL